MEPKALVDLLNVYFTGMVESVLRHHGVVDKFIGDGMMAVFGAPKPESDDALRAVRAALEMRTRLVDLNESFSAAGLAQLRIGIGIHSGPVVAGNIGHVERKEYTVIGDSVNVSSRLESLTKELASDILLSEDTYSLVAEAVEAEPLRAMRVKGREKEVMVYRLIGLKTGEALN
jgi:adenylate cyclase